MPLSKKLMRPLFHEKTLAKAVDSFSFPPDLDRRYEIVSKWIDTLKSDFPDFI